MRKICLLVLLTAASVRALSQMPAPPTPAADSTETEKKRSYGKAGLEFMTNAVYFGRADSLSTPYLTPSLGYYDKSGFYVLGYMSMLLRSGDTRVDLSALSAGYSFEKGAFYGELNAEKYFYNTKSTNVAAEVKAATSLSLGYDLGFMQPSITPGVNFASKSDFWLTLGLEKSLEFGKKKWEFTPMALLNGSTRNFYGSYFANRRFRKKGTGPGTTITASVPDASQFKWMDGEFSLPLKYTHHRFSVSVSPTYAIPLNPATVQLVVKPPVGPSFTRSNTERIKNRFYGIVNLEYQF